MRFLISVENPSVNYQCLKDIFKIFANPGEYFEIHCWKNENDEIQMASQFGEIACFDIPSIKIIHGTVNERFIAFILNEDILCEKKFYNKIVPFYTVHIGDHVSFEDYGARMILNTKSNQQKNQVKELLESINATVKHTSKQEIWRIL